MSVKTKYHEENVFMFIHSASIYLRKLIDVHKIKACDTCLYNDEDSTKNKYCSISLKSTGYIEIYTSNQS